MLGGRECDSIAITKFDWTNSGVRPTNWANPGKGNANYCTIICQANGSRLLGGALTGLTFTISPNPTDDAAIFSLRTVESGKYNVTVLNTTGQVVKQFDFDAQANRTYEFDQPLSDISNGLYYVRYSSPTRSVVAPFYVLK